MRSSCSFLGRSNSFLVSSFRIRFPLLKQQQRIMLHVTHTYNMFSILWNIQETVKCKISDIYFNLSIKEHKEWPSWFVFSIRTKTKSCHQLEMDEWTKIKALNKLHFLPNIRTLYFQNQPSWKPFNLSWFIFYQGGHTVKLSSSKKYL